jgi:clan AA aspartic protease (TIGR02281 family)
MRMIRATLAASLTMMAIARIAAAGPLENAEAAYHRGDYRIALQLWRRMADQGNAEAQYKLGTLYLDGLFEPFTGELVHQNCTEALRLIGIAAKQGLVAAQYDLADLYTRGYCVSSDADKAREWRRKADSHGPAVPNERPFSPIESPLKEQSTFEAPLKKEGGTFVVPVQINGAITLDFTVDSGAADVSVPADVFSTLARTGTIRNSDIIGEETYKLADGSTHRAMTFTIRSLKVGDRVVEGVRGSVASSQGSLLLGQSFLERFRSWSFDNTRHVLLLQPK